MCCPRWPCAVHEVVVIAGGRLRASGPLHRVLGAVGSADGPATVVRAPDDAALTAAAAAAPASPSSPPPDGALLVRGAAPERVGALAAAHGVALAELRGVAPSLEDAFLSR